MVITMPPATASGVGSSCNQKYPIMMEKNGTVNKNGAALDAKTLDSANPQAK